MTNCSKLKTISLIAAVLILCAVVLASDSRKKDDPWVPMAERVRIWGEVVAKELGLGLPLKEPKPYTVSQNGLEATFEKAGAKWTIIGANASIVNPTVYPKNWPVKGNNFEVLVIPEPITNYKILPFTEKIENAVKSDTITVTGAPDSYEPASFVIRAVDVDLKDVMVEVSDLKADVRDKNGRKTVAIFPKENIDVRVVKCWFQAGDQLNDTRHKMLKPELLLHDDGLVRVDYDRQLNMIREYDFLKDAEALLPFEVPKRQNKQVWITMHILSQYPPAKYHGRIRIMRGNTRIRDLGVELNILPFTLPQPMIDYALYYEGYLADESAPKIEARRKTTAQMNRELMDMKEHGLTNVTLWHQVSKDKSKWPEDWGLLQRTIDLRKKVGWGAKPLLYLDWKAVHWEDPRIYQEKIYSIIDIAKRNNIADVYIYGLDERKDEEFAAIKQVYRTVHETGAKNFVAMTENTYLRHGFDLIDIPIFWGMPGIHIKHMQEINKKSKRVWKYSQPQAGLEEPGTYRRNYGVKLLTDGFAGACDYQYQRGSWNDFADPNGRMNTMAYPTVDRPVPTLQWEGWRTAIDDVRYITVLKNRGLLGDEWLKGTCLEDVNSCRTRATEFILDSASNRN